MADQEQLKEKFDQSVHQDRAAQIRQAAMKSLMNKDPRMKMAGKMIGDERMQKLMGPQAQVKKLFWSLIGQGFIPIFGFFQAMGAFILWWVIKLGGEKLAAKGVKIKLGLLITLGVWLVFIGHFVGIFLTIVIIYIIINPSLWLELF